MRTRSDGLRLIRLVCDKSFLYGYPRIPVELLTLCVLEHEPCHVIRFRVGIFPPIATNTTRQLLGVQGCDVWRWNLHRNRLKRIRLHVSQALFHAAEDIEGREFEVNGLANIRISKARLQESFIAPRDSRALYVVICFAAKLPAHQPRKSPRPVFEEFGRLIG